MVEPAYTRKQAYVLRLHELLWAFIHAEDKEITGIVHEVAEEILERKGINHGGEKCEQD